MKRVWAETYRTASNRHLQLFCGTLFLVMVPASAWPTPFSDSTSARDLVAAGHLLPTICAIWGVHLGAAEFHDRSVVHSLLAIPRRLPWAVARLAAVVVVSTAFLVPLLFSSVLASLIASGGAAWGRIPQMAPLVGEYALLCVCFTVVGWALGMATRSLLGGVAVYLGYSLVLLKLMSEAVPRWVWPARGGMDSVMFSPVSTLGVPSSLLNHTSLAGSTPISGTGVALWTMALVLAALAASRRPVRP